MKAIQLAKPGGLDRLDSVDIEAPGALASGDTTLTGTPQGPRRLA